MTDRSDAGHRGPTRPLFFAVLGAATFAVLHLLFTLGWESWFQPAELEVAWFLGSRRALITAQVVFGVVALLAGLGRRRGWPRRFREATALAAGAVLAMAATFAVTGAERLLLGPARLWPVALLAGAIVLALPVVAGTLAAGILTRARRADGSGH